jgi:hypothetical protein
MKHVDVEALVENATKIPVKMDRAAKLAQWAKIVREYKDGTLYLYHRLEYWTVAQLKGQPVGQGEPTAFALAVEDPIFREQGLTKPSDVHKIMGFFELSQAELHEFGCDCGGDLSNKQMADRIEKLAKPATGPVSRIVNGITRMIG